MSRITKSLKTACLLSLSLLAATADGAATPRHLLFMVHGGGQAFTADVFGYVEDGKIQVVPPESYGDFTAAAFKGRKYTLYIAGKPVEPITVTGVPERESCDAPSVTMSTDKPAYLVGFAAFASDADFKPVDYTERNVTDDELAILRKLADQVYAQKKAPKAVYEKAQLYSSAVIEKGQERWLVGSFRAVEPTPKDKSIPVGNTDSVFLIAESSGGPFKRTFMRYDSDDTSYSDDFREILDLDGDGVPEIVTEYQISEGSVYSIYKKTADGWDRIFQDGYGC